jgi:hypothetical protein
MNKLDKFEHLLGGVFNIMAFTRTVITVIIFGIMIFQLFSCTAPPQLTAYEQHKYDVEMYRNMKTLEGTPYNELQDMWGTLYIEAQLISMEIK